MALMWHFISVRAWYHDQMIKTLKYQLEGLSGASEFVPHGYFQVLSQYKDFSWVHYFGKYSRVLSTILSL